MLEYLFPILESWIQTAGGFGVFGASVLEEVFSIIPSSLVQFGAGFFLLAGSPMSGYAFTILVFKIGFMAALGVTLGSLVYYAIGWWGGEPVIKKWGKWVGIHWSDVERFQGRLGKAYWDDALFFFLRATPFMPSIVLSIGPGVLKMNVWKYSLITFLGVWIRTIVLGFIGWQLGDAYKKYEVVVNKLEYVGLAIILAIVVWWIFFRKSKKQSQKE